MPRPIPERVPVEERFDGILLRAGAYDGLALQPQPDTTILVQGSLALRFGIRFLGKPHRSIVPGLVVLDYGDMLTGDAAWDFLQHRSNLHPRAEVAGYRDDGSDDLVFVRTLDLALAPQVLVYADAASQQPIGRPAFVIAPATAELPPHLTAYLPRYDSIAQWHAKESQ